MSRRMGEIAEKAAAGITRRGMFGWLAKGAVPTAALLGGWLAAGEVKATEISALCCTYFCRLPNGNLEASFCVPQTELGCPELPDCRLCNRNRTNDCNRCLQQRCRRGS
jgi:hypothetical protein